MKKTLSILMLLAAFSIQGAKHYKTSKKNKINVEGTVDNINGTLFEFDENGMPLGHAVANGLEAHHFDNQCKAAQDKKAKTPAEDDKPKKTKQGEPETKEEQPQKARRLSKQEILQAMQGMDTNQMASMPLDLQQEYFKSIRAPKKSSEFDNITFEALTNQFGINTTSNLPYNQQVINALIFAAKLKAGASEQELNALFFSKSRRSPW